MATHRIAYDVKLKRPGCVLLQAALGGDAHLVGRKFTHETWLLHPTDDLHVYEVTDDQLEKLVKITEDGLKKGKKKP